MDFLRVGGPAPAPVSTGQLSSLSQYCNIQLQTTAAAVLQVFEAYCLVVLRVGGPAPRPVPAGQLATAGQAYWDAVVTPVAAQRPQLLEAMRAAGVIAGAETLTQPGDGHLLLFDVVLPGVLGLTCSNVGSAVVGAFKRKLLQWLRSA